MFFCGMWKRLWKVCGGDYQQKIAVCVCVGYQGGGEEGEQTEKGGG